MVETQYLDQYDARNILAHEMKKEGKRRVAIDVRVSTQHEEQINALANQKQWAIELANEHEDWIFNPEKDLYVEEGKSGTSYKGRAELEEMLCKAKNGEYDLIVVREVSRLMRNARLTLDLVDQLKQKGVEVYFVNDGIWSYNDNDYFKLTIMAQYAEQESKKISERVFSGQASTRRNRILMGSGNILGYNFIKGDRSLKLKPRYEINEEQAETVRLIFKMALEGYGTRRIAKYLEENGYKTATGKTNWYATGVKEILRRRTYMGELEYSQTVTKDPLTHERMKSPKDHRVPEKIDEIPKIIEPDVWKKVQEEIAKRTNFDTSKAGKAIVHGRVENKDVYCRKMRCGCGRRLKKDTEYRYGDRRSTYICYQTQEDMGIERRKKQSLLLEDNCCIYGIRDWRLDLYTLKVFQYFDYNLSEIKRKLIEIINMSYVEIDDSGCNIDVSIMKLEKEINNLKEQNERLLDNLEMGYVDGKDYKLRKSKNDKEILDRIAQKERLQAEQYEKHEKENTLNRARKFLDESLELPQIGKDDIKIPDILIDTYVNSIKVCANSIFEYNVKVNPAAEVQLSTSPEDIFKPHSASTRRVLDNSNAVLITEFTVSYDEVKEYANKINRKARRTHFGGSATIRIYANL